MKLKHIANVRAGHPFRGAIKESPEGNGFVVQIRDQERDGQINWNSLMKTEVKGRGAPEWLGVNDVIFAARGNRNLAAVVPDLEKPSVCSPHYFVISVKDASTVLPEFVAWQLNQPRTQRYFQKSAEGSAQVSIRRSILEDTPLSVPPIELQKTLMVLVTEGKREEMLYRRLIELRKTEIQAVATQILNEHN